MKTHPFTPIQNLILDRRSGGQTSQRHVKNDMLSCCCRFPADSWFIEVFKLSYSNLLFKFENESFGIRNALTRVSIPNLKGISCRSMCTKKRYTVYLNSTNLVGGFNLFEKYWSKWVHLPQIRIDHTKIFEGKPPPIFIHRNNWAHLWTF